jgi:hypothetical protein
MVNVIFTEKELSCLFDLKNELRSELKHPSLYVVVNYKKVEVPELVNGTVAYLDSESSLSFNSLIEIKKFIQASQRWNFERFLADEDLLEDFKWDNIESEGEYDNLFEKFIITVLHFRKVMYDFIPFDMETFFTRKEAEVYLEESKGNLHEKAHLEERKVLIETKTAELLNILYRIANEAA